MSLSTFAVCLDRNGATKFLASAATFNSAIKALQLPEIVKFSFIDASVWIVAFVATIVLNTELGLGVAVLYLLLTLALRSNQEATTELESEGTFTFLHKEIYV